MTKKDYILISRAINCTVWNFQGEDREQKAIAETIERLCEEFARDNTRFNKQKFIEACYKK